MRHKAKRVDNLMYKGCEPHWQCIHCGKAVPFHCYSKNEFEQQCCGCHKINCDNCDKRSDKDIIKALEICTDEENLFNCDKCVFVKYKLGHDGCYAEMLPSALDLINRQQAEIERLKKTVDIHKGIAEDWKYEARRLKEMVGDDK